MRAKNIAMRLMWAPLLTAVMAVAAGCSKSSVAPVAAPAAAKPSLGIRPLGDETVKIDMTQIYSEDLKKVYAHMDEHIDEHVVNLQKWIQQPSISNTGEGTTSPRH